MNNQALQTAGLAIGVIKSTSVDLNKECTRALMETGHSETIQLAIKNNAGYVLGKLCVLDMTALNVWPADSPEYRFKVLTHKVVSSAFVRCPDCGIEVMSKNLKKHKKRKHERPSTS